MSETFSTEVYAAWRGKQRQKYAQLFPRLKPLLSSEFSLLDLGIGQGWFESFLAEQGLRFNQVVGFDVQEKAVAPRLEGVDYVIAPRFTRQEKFDFVVCFDAYHLMDQNPLDFVKAGGLLLVSLPLRWREKLNDFGQQEIIAQGEIGQEEVDRFLLIRKG